MRENIYIYIEPRGKRHRSQPGRSTEGGRVAAAIVADRKDECGGDFSRRRMSRIRACTAGAFMEQTRGDISGNG